MLCDKCLLVGGVPHEMGASLSATSFGPNLSGVPMRQGQDIFDCACGTYYSEGQFFEMSAFGQVVNKRRLMIRNQDCPRFYISEVGADGLLTLACVDHADERHVVAKSEVRPV